MRLIDADELIKSFKEFENDEASQELYGKETLSLVLSDCVIDVEKQPTAYDIDKVAEILLKNEKVMEICLDKEFDKDLVSAIKGLFRTYTESQIKIIRESIKNG